MPISEKAAPSAVAATAAAAKLLPIQILRGAAAVGVVLFHSVGNSRSYTGDQENRLLHVFENGGHGVDLFFVISGFIICCSTRASATSRGAFLRRRLERIAPIYWIFTAVMAAAALLVPSLFSNASDVLGLRAVSSFLFASFLGDTTPIIYVGWSLELEMFFYLVVALLLHPSERMWSQIVYLFSILTILHVAPFTKTLGVVHGFFTQPRLLEFAYGVLAALIVARRPVAKPFAVAALATLTVSADDDAGSLIGAGLPAALLVLLAAFWSERDRRPTAVERLCGRIGDASYSIYLVQVFVISAVGKTVSRLHASIDILILVETGLSILAGYAVFRLLEQPLLAALRSFRSKKSNARDDEARPERVA
ncbi:MULTISPECIES: acyltransferase family protein [Methylosinus]|uniref:Acyltransferase n=1 Tax=Methylosinus trichosporium (strain ATCC 35070 / NCIMB 11131 / UNIQEM 75 / OB3b) TaxID=595536 RepID=A0A2D2D2A3_METT3|nr:MULTISPECIES: acyltransferase [Methylosinus]ATQ69137.1 acyltransferase [Methylosinus trichosporium OB3b]OBS53561.1 hypothetical protein A8B73_05015 [Methylosinus sp. 3S-1]